MNQYDHIQIERQEIAPAYQGHPYPNAPKPPQRDKLSHGKKLSEDITVACNSLKQSRAQLGIQTDKLLVLELSCVALPPELINQLVDNFELYLVDERKDYANGKSTLLFQFEDFKSIQRFNEERELWVNDSSEKKVLSYAKRRDLFNSIESIRGLTAEDRKGPRLRDFLKQLEDTDFFLVDVDIWFNNNVKHIIEIETQIKKALGTGGSQLCGDLFQIPDLLLGRAKVNKYTVNALLQMDIVSRIELVAEAVHFETVSYDLDIKPSQINNQLTDIAPLATVLDSGVFHNHPLLKSCVIDSFDFDQTESTVLDLNGHGSGVAGIVVYGDLASQTKQKIFSPAVKIFNAKIMHDKDDATEFRDDIRPEQLVARAIKHFYEKYGCRIFNLSVGDSSNAYSGGRQLTWASLLDNLAKMLDVVIVISAGNVSTPVIPNFTSREDLISKVRDQLIDSNHRLIDPATSALNITVGSIARSDNLDFRNNQSLLPVGKKDFPSAFTRIGPGVSGAVKPDFVEYGGNFCLRQYIRGQNRWCSTNKQQLELSLGKTNEAYFVSHCGTSFAAPYVTHIAARMERVLQQQMGKKPSANLIRAMLASFSRHTPEMQACASNCQGANSSKLPMHTLLYGYGKIPQDILFSTDNRVTLFAEDSLPLNDFHLYRIPVPPDFLTAKSDKLITISLAFNPQTKSTRQDYLANQLWFEVYRRIDQDSLVKKKSKNILKEDINSLNPNKVKMTPSSRSVNKSTLQQRCWIAGPRAGDSLLWPGVENPYLFVLVTGKEKFSCAENNMPQPYALCVTFESDSKEDIDLYNQLKNQARLKVPVKVREKVSVKVPV